MTDSNETTTDDVPGSGPYSPGPNRFTGGGTTVDDVAPVEGRSDGTSKDEDPQGS